MYIKHLMLCLAQKGHSINVPFPPSFFLLTISPLPWHKKYSYLLQQNCSLRVEGLPFHTPSLVLKNTVWVWGGSCYIRGACFQVLASYFISLTFHLLLTVKIKIFPRRWHWRSNESALQTTRYSSNLSFILQKHPTQFIYCGCFS